MPRLELIEPAQRIQDGVLDEILRIERTPRGGREPSACPAAQRRKASRKQLIERVAIAGAHAREQLERRFQRVPGGTFVRRHNLFAGLMIPVPRHHSAHRTRPCRQEAARSLHLVEQRNTGVNRTPFGESGGRGGCLAARIEKRGRNNFRADLVTHGFDCHLDLDDGTLCVMRPINRRQRDHFLQDR